MKKSQFRKLSIVLHIDINCIWKFFHYLLCYIHQLLYIFINLSSVRMYKNEFRFEVFCSNAQADIMLLVFVFEYDSSGSCLKLFHFWSGNLFLTRGVWYAQLEIIVCVCLYACVCIHHCVCACVFLSLCVCENTLYNLENIQVRIEEEPSTYSTYSDVFCA